MGAAAQAVYGSLSGSIADNSGGALPGVTVTIKSVERNTVDTVVTNESGIYGKDRLLPGTYEVKAELAGFKAAVVPRVTVSVDTQTPVNFKLEVGAVSEEVTVSGGAPLLKTDRADVATRFDSKELTELPVLDRNFTKFILLTPGAQQMGWQHAASENPQGSTQTQINGQHFSGTGYQLDGTENRDPILGIIVVNPSLESIGESKITSQNYDAEFGQATAGVVSVQTKSGANEVHGSGFEFYRSEALQARNPFRSRASIRSPASSSRTRRRTSSADRWAARSGRTSGSSSATTRARARIRAARSCSRCRRRWRARATSASTARQSTTRLTGAAFRERDHSDLATVAAGAQAARPHPAAERAWHRERHPRQLHGVGGRELHAELVQHPHRRPAVGQDEHVRPLSARQVPPDGGGALGIAGGPQFVGIAGISESRNQSLAYGIDTTVSPSLLVDFRFGWFQYKVDVLPADFGTTPAADAGIPNLNNDDTFTSGLPSLFMRGNQADMNWGYGLGVNGCNCPLAENEKQWQMVGNITKIWGNHTSKAGIDVRRAYNLRVPSDQHRSGELTFNALRTSNAGVGGLGLATFLLGDVSNGTGVAFARYVSSSTDARERQWRHFYYAQDTWRANTKLTLNYGLRLDVINPQTVNDAGNGDVGRSVHRARPRRRRRRHRSRRQRREPPELGAAPRRHVSAERQDGAPRRLRPQLRHRRLRFAVRPHRHAEPAGAGGAEHDRPEPVRIGLQPGAGTAGAELGAAQRGRHVRAGRTGSSRWSCRASSVRRTVDAWNVTVQRQLSDTLSVEVGYVGNYGRHVFAGDNPDENLEPGGPRRLPGRRPVQPAAAVLRRRRHAERARRRRQLRLDADGAGAIPTRRTTGTRRCRPSSPGASARAGRRR